VRLQTPDNVHCAIFGSEKDLAGNADVPNLCVPTWSGHAADLADVHQMENHVLLPSQNNNTHMISARYIEQVVRVLRGVREQFAAEENDGKMDPDKYRLVFSVTLHLVLKELRVLSKKMRDAEKSSRMSAVWCFASIVVDRACLYIYVLVSIIFGCVMLCWHPSYDTDVTKSCRMAGVNAESTEI
jgi:hypothetical protein